MFTYRSIDYADFSEFAQVKSYVFDDVDFSKSTPINKSIDDITSNDVFHFDEKIETCSVYEISGVKFAVSEIYEGIETTSNGNTNKRKRRLVRLEKSDEIKRFDDITQLKRILGAATGQRPSAIICKGRKNKGFQTATPDNIGEQKEKLNALLASLDVLKEIADICPLIEQIRQAVRNVWANDLKGLRQKAQKDVLMEQLKGLCVSEMAQIMALLKK